MKYQLKLIYGAAVGMLLLSRCKKEDAFLAAKPNQQLSEITSLTDAANVMHDELVFNQFDPALGQIGCDDYYLSDDLYTGLDETLEEKGYIWAKSTYDPGQYLSDWSQPYQQVYYANTVLDALPKIPVPVGQQAKADEVKGDALFYRSRAFFNLMDTFCLPYKASTVATDMGIPLRLSSDINIKLPRANLKDCYTQVLADLNQAVLLLPVKPAYITQPSKPAAYGCLARIYLAMGDFDNAFKSADAALKLNSTLTDYNTITPVSRAISATFLSEDIFHTVISTYEITSVNSYSLADTSLYRSYGNNDLRKTLFFVIKSGSPYFRGTYDFKKQPYSGIAVDELYLDRAECEARQSNTEAAMKDLNTLLATRWVTGTFVPYTASSPDDALTQILGERRKELIWRGLRWTDIRRLNNDPKTAITLKRTILGSTYTLPPGDLRFAWLIPDQEINNSTITQNQR